MESLGTVEVEHELSRQLEAARTRAARFGVHYQALWEAITEASFGGKRVRPALVLTAHEQLGGVYHQSANQVAVAFELLHTGLLIHDDVIDNDVMRRGQGNIAFRFGQRALQWGANERQRACWQVSSAILAGDLALSLSQKIIAELTLPRFMRTQLIEIFDDALFVSAAGELADVTNTAQGETIGLDEILHTLAYKTAVYSFEAPLQAGAVLANADSELIDALGSFGRKLGVAYQMRDDLLGVFGDPEQTGKSVNADLREGKATVLTVFARQHERWPEIAQHIGNPLLSDADADAVRDCFRQCGVEQRAVVLLEQYVDAARAILTNGAIPFSLASRLEAYTCSLTERVR